jgi:hypothetical protein
MNSTVEYLLLAELLLRSQYDFREHARASALIAGWDASAGDLLADRGIGHHAIAAAFRDALARPQ